MKKTFLIALLPFVTFAIAPNSKYQSCLDASNKFESPADRDGEKVDCFNRGRIRKSLSTCLNLARILEHTSTADSLILSCLSENISELKLADCLGTSKKLYYSENRDKAYWMCLENKPIGRSQCKEITDKMTYPHNRNIALNYCLMKN